MAKSYCRIGIAIVAALVATLTPKLGVAVGYLAHNLVSDQPGVADTTDPDLVNAWGVAFNPTGFAWVADNHSGKGTLYDGLGAKNSLIVGIPDATGTVGNGAPTGIVFSGGNDFVVTQGTDSGPARFIFAGEDGVISAWAPNVPLPAPATVAHVAANRSSVNAIYKGLALGVSGGSDFLYATDFHNGRIDVFNNSFGLTSLAGNFTDPNIPAGFAPFGIQNISGQLFVTYAQQDANAEDDSPGPGNGFVDIFDTGGNFVKRLVSQGSLNSPWGLAKAPANFGDLSNALLVGNFGDGRIHAYDPTTGAALGTLSDASNTPITIDGLWGLQFGNGIMSQPTNTLFFAAGPGDEAHGLYGRIDVVPEPGGLLLAMVGAASFVVARVRLRRQ
ncbi:MAG TPA: TIGR03118 family protein [Lacipirellulaceae bacterium]|nr:TIGR03118 family protein [Lacipirellulaceae bacterium]